MVQLCDNLRNQGKKKNCQSFFCILFSLFIQVTEIREDGYVMEYISELCIYTCLKGALCSFREEIQTQNFDEAKIPSQIYIFFTISE